MLRRRCFRGGLGSGLGLDDASRRLRSRLGPRPLPALKALRCPARKPLRLAGAAAADSLPARFEALADFWPSLAHLGSKSGLEPCALLERGS